MQQYLPFTVLKQFKCKTGYIGSFKLVATVLTVYGIETKKDILVLVLKDINGVATVLTVYGIETQRFCAFEARFFWFVATVLTVYGIETC